MGGLSAEREISLRSGRAVWAALSRNGYDAIRLEVDASVVARLREVRAQIAFIALHGPGGEDGTIQGMLEVLRMPYTGSGVQACALAMDKAMTKCLLEHGDLPVPRGFVRTLRERRRPLPSGFKLPLVVKPVSQGSTLGITIIRKRRGLGAALQAAFAYGSAGLIEEDIDGLGLTVSIFNEPPLPGAGIISKRGFFDFRAQDTPG